MGLIILLPIFILISFFIFISDGGKIFFRQKRVGKNGIDFNLIKFRTMKSSAEKQGQLTIGSTDSRITKVGYYLRKMKFDELPQLLNVLFGDMSLVGPRPEVRKYVDLYNEEQKKVLSVKPGITDNASIKYFAESDLLAKSENPEKTYIEIIMPEKLKINLEYIQNPSIGKDFAIIFRTIGRIFKSKKV